LILRASSYLDIRHATDGKTMLYVDLKPALDPGQLDRRILREFEANNKKQFRNSLNTMFPARLIPVMIFLSGIEPDKKVCEITKAQRKAFVDIIKNIPLTVSGNAGYREAVITKGGISVKEVNSSTLESIKVSGIYFAGEVLDLDALTGGFNLQIAWSTGYLAGKKAGMVHCR
jgi:predicted Rossmann fold flavoprotein